MDSLQLEGWMGRIQAIAAVILSQLIYEQSSSLSPPALLFPSYQNSLAQGACVHHCFSQVSPSRYYTAYWWSADSWSQWLAQLVDPGSYSVRRWGGDWLDHLSPVGNLYEE
jgi:hypothetical protein